MIVKYLVNKEVLELIVEENAKIFDRFFDWTLVEVLAGENIPIFTPGFSPWEKEEEEEEVEEWMEGME